MIPSCTIGAVYKYSDVIADGISMVYQLMVAIVVFHNKIIMMQMMGMMRAQMMKKNRMIMFSLLFLIAFNKSDLAMHCRLTTADGMAAIYYQAIMMAIIQWNANCDLHN